MDDDFKAIERFGKVFFDSYFVVDRERRVQDFNEIFVQLLGLRPVERRKIKGSHCYELLKLDICRNSCIALECLTKGGPVRKEELKGTTASERGLVLELSAVPLCDASGLVAAVFVTHRDVTDERRLKTRYLEEAEKHRTEREALLNIIKERDEELQELRHAGKVKR